MNTHDDPPGLTHPQTRCAGLWHRRAGRLALTTALVMGGVWALHAAAPGAISPETHAASGPVGTLLALLAGLLVCSGLVSSSETALFSLDKLDRSRIRNGGAWSERAVVQLLDRPHETLATILIANNTVNIAVTLTTAALTYRLLPVGSAAAFAAAAAAATVALLLFGEILPKLIASMYPHRVACVLAPPLIVLDGLLTPVRAAVGLLTRGLYRALNIPVDTTDDEVSEEELKVMIGSTEVASVLEEDELEMIDGVFDLRRTTVDEIFMPRFMMQAVSDDLTQDEMLERLRQSPHSRMPVYRETTDQVVGFLLAKEVLLDAEGDWRTHLREPLCVPEGVGLLDLLKTFRAERTKMAMVVDEFGGVSGVVTLQDVLEEIVGDIYETHEVVEDSIHPLVEGRWMLSGSVALSDVADTLDVALPDDKGRTLGGFVMNALGRIPRVGDEALHEGWTFIVREMVGRRVHRVEAVAPDDPRSASSGKAGAPR